MLINSLALAISTSIDSLGIGITYGIRQTKLTKNSKIVLFLISIYITSIAVFIGNIIRTILSEYIANLIGVIILVGMGLCIIIESMSRNKKSNNMIDLEIENNEQKIHKFFIKSLGITIQIIRDPIFSDLDKSKYIDMRESIYLGIALSLDSLCIGIGSTIIGISSFYFPLLVAVFQLIFLSFGIFLGKKIVSVSKLPNNIWNIISGTILICIGIIKIIL